MSYLEKKTWLEVIGQDVVGASNFRNYYCETRGIDGKVIDKEVGVSRLERMWGVALSAQEERRERGFLRLKKGLYARADYIWERDPLFKRLVWLEGKTKDTDPQMSRYWGSMAEQRMKAMALSADPARLINEAREDLKTGRALI